MENLNTKILNKGEKKMSNKTQVWVIDWIETETNKIDVSAKEEKKENHVFIIAETTQYGPNHVILNSIL